MRLLPKTGRFFEKFVEQAATIHEAAVLLLDMLEKSEGFENTGAKITDLEHRGDNITHEILTSLNQTFITPFDREDIHALSSRLDDVLDLIEAAANKVVFYKITGRMQPAVELAQIIVRCAERIKTAMAALERQDRILDHCIELNRLENEGDRISRVAIAQLFEQERDPITLIKRKELYEVLEDAIDCCEDVANVLESVVLKSN
jgi:predicted phosphate transport protein (TIGR00153 family)